VTFAALCDSINNIASWKISWMNFILNSILDYEELLGFVAAAFGTISFLPQVVKIWKSHSVSDISTSMYVIYAISIILWLFYGIIIKSIPLITAEILTLILVSMILVMKYLWK
jgi:MtN3 and saliva related transmembrane protein